MQKHMKDYLNELRKQQQRRKKAAIAAVLLVVLVVGMVANGLTGSGVAMTGDDSEVTTFADTDAPALASAETTETDDVSVLAEISDLTPEPAEISDVTSEPEPGPAEVSDPTSAPAPEGDGETVESQTSEEAIPDAAEAFNEEETIASNSKVADGSWSFDAHYVNQDNLYNVELTENFNLKYQMEFHADENIGKGQVVIKIDAALFNDRNGNPVKPSDIGVPQGTPESYTSNRSTPFNYYYEGDKLVFFNYKEISSGYNAAWQVLYKDQKLMNIKDGTKWSKVPEISVDSGKEGTFKETTALEGKTDSWVRLDSVVKSYYTESGLNYTPGLYTLNQVKRYVDGEIDKEFKNDDGRLDTAKWRYVVWDVKVKGTATQPWNMVIDDVPGLGCKVVGYKDNSDKATAYKLAIGKVAEDGTALSNQKEDFWGNRFWVVTAYPADQVEDGTQVKNDITITLDPYDDMDEEVSLVAPTATWNYRDYDWTYSGNAIGVEKKTDNTVYTGWLDAYRLSKVSNEDYGDMPFTTTGRMYGYGFTHRIENDGNTRIGDYIPKTYYTLTTVDDFMYLYSGVATDNGTTAAQRLGEDDYYFSGVTVTQTDYGYDVWEGEVASQLGEVNDVLLPDALKNGSKVRIYAMLAKPSSNEKADNWVLIDTITMDENGQMEYSFPEDIIAQQPWRVKVEHDTIDYKTICKIDVNVRIKHDSTKMGELITDRESAETNAKSPEVKFENLSGVMGIFHAGDGKVSYFTESDNQGNNVGGNKNYTGRDDLADATTGLYKDNEGKGILLIRDNAFRTVTWLNETAASFKMAKSTNDVNNNRVLVDYYLTAYDGYEIYNKSSLDYLRAEDQKLISPGRSHVVFYDLLPYGMQFDASAPITAGRITNLSNDTYQTQPKSWDGNQVTVTVDPKKDIIANYRGTGRTMIAFHVSFSGADATSYTGKKWIEGWGVSFRAYYDWKDMDQLNNIDINANLSAFMPDFSELAGGSNENHPALVGLKTEVDYDNGTQWNKEDKDWGAVNPAYTDMVKEYKNEGPGNIDGFNEDIKDENGDFVTDENGQKKTYDTTYRNVLYAKNVLNDDMAISSESKIEKLVRVDADRFGAFDRTAVVSAGDGEESFYTYDITVSTATGIKDIIVFDRLEQAATDRKGTNDPFVSEFNDNTWSGTFRSVDTSGLDKQGIFYTVYYSDKKDATIKADDENFGNDWYTETAFAKKVAEEFGEDWQKAAKAVAVKLYDLEEHPDYSFELGDGKSISFQIKMKAPGELEEGVDRSTYNNASFSSRPITGGEKETRIGNSVKVTLNDSETLEIIKKTEGNVPAALLDERFEFRLYEEYTYEGKTETRYLAYTEYQLYKLGNTEPESGVYSTDGNGYLYLNADEKAVFKMAGVDRVQVKETENVFWDSKTVENKRKDGEPRTLTVTNTYRPVLYAQKNLSAVPDGVNVRNEEFTFKIEIKRNNAYVPLKNAEFWYVSSARLDGGIPEKLNSGKTDNEGNFTIKQGEIIALFPGVEGTEYRLSEPESGADWICETNTLTGIMTVGGRSVSITNYYKWKDLLLTKDITHQTKKDYDKNPQEFTFRIREVGKDENGAEIITPVIGKEWVLLDESETTDTETADEDASESESVVETVPTSGFLDENGEFTCNMGFRTVRIKGLEAGKTYRIEELTEGIREEDMQPLYISVDGTATTTMPVFSTRRNLTITNDYQKRPLSVKKTVVKSNSDNVFGPNNGGFEMLSLDDSINDTTEPDGNVFYRFTATVNGTLLPQGTPYTVTKAGGKEEIRHVGELDDKNPVFANADGYGSVLGPNQFMLADGETATFENVGMIGAEIEVTEIDNDLQVYPAKETPYTGTLSGDGAEASFVNGEPGSLLIKKEYVGLDEIGEKAAEELNTGNPWYFGPNPDDMDLERNVGSVDFILKITDSDGTYTWPESQVTIGVINERGDREDRDIEKGDFIRVNPGETLIIPTGNGTSIPADATYTLEETEESKNQIRLYQAWDNDYIDYEEYYLQISQSAASDALSKPESVSGRPSAVIYNEISTINKIMDGSTIEKQMTYNSREVPDGKKLVWRVERYDAGRGEWYPAEGTSYIVTCEGMPIFQQVESTKGDGWITLVKEEYGYPQVWFPEDKVYINLYDEWDINDLSSGLEPGKALLRVVEVPEESDKEWGMLVGYLGRRVIDMPDILLQSVSESMGVALLNNSGMNVSRGLIVSGSGGGTNQQDYSLDINPRYATAFVNSNNKASLEVEKYMSIASDTLFTMIVEQVVSTTCPFGMIDSSNYDVTITGTRPGAGIPYTIHNADGSVAGSGVTGSGGEIQLEAGQYASLEVFEGTMWTVSEKTSASPNYSLKDLQPESGDPRMKKLNDNLMLINVPEGVYMTQYRVEWYLDDTLQESETREGIVGTIVSAGRRDYSKYSFQGYEFMSFDRRNITETRLTVDGENTLRLYFYKPEVEYTVVWCDTDGNEIDSYISFGIVGETVSVTEEDKSLCPDGYVFDENNSGNILEKVLTSEGPNVLKLYCRVKVEVVRTFTVMYTDGVNGVIIFPDQSYEGLKEGDATPVFVGTPIREGYEFMGWAPTVNPVISGDDADEDEEIIYTATWYKNRD